MEWYDFWYLLQNSLEAPNKNSKTEDCRMGAAWQSQDGAWIVDAVLVHEGSLCSTFQYGSKRL